MKTPLLIIALVLVLPAWLLAANEQIVIGGLDGLDPDEAHSQHAVVLAISGGGMRGLATIGILQAFEERGLRVAGIAGTSMGGIVGGLYAAGYSPWELEIIATQLDFANLFKNQPARTTMLQTRRQEQGRDLLSIRFDGLRPIIPRALTSGQNLTNFLINLTTRATYRSSGNFSKLRIPFATVSTDVVSGKREVLRTGSLADAMRATMAFPLAFTGLEIDGQLLMDGGMVDPIPVDVARGLSDSVDYVVAINTASPLLPKDQLKTPVDIANQVTTIMSAEKLAAALEKADFVIAPVPDDIGSTDFRYYDSLIQLGYSAGIAAADSIIAQLDERADSNCYTITQVAIDSNLVNGHQWLEEELAGHYCTRPELVNLLKDASREMNLFRLEADISSDGSAGSESAYTIRLSGYRPMDATHLVIDFEGNTMFDDSTLVLTLGLSDSLITRERLSEALDRVRRLYFDEKWDLFNIRDVDIHPEAGRITIHVDEAIIKGVEVDGEERTKAWYIRAHFPLSVGQPFSTERAAEGVRNIYGTGLFERVTADLVPSNGVAIVHVRVLENKHRQVRFGWHWDDEYESEEFIELVDDNVGGFGLETLLHARYSPDQQDYHVSIKADRIFKTYLTSRLLGYHKFLNRHLYDSEDSLIGKREERKTGVTLSLGQQIARLGTVSAKVTVEEVDYDFNTNPETSVEFGLRVLTLESLVETFDRIPFPHSGKKVHLEFQQAGEVLGGDMEYSRFYADVEAYFPLGRHLTYHPRIEVGGSRPALPLSEQFYLGGMHSFAGYRTYQLFGEKMFVISNEVRAKLPLRLYFSVRYDIGNVFASTDDIKLKSSLQGAGAFLALDTPLGPFEIGYGIAEDERDRFYLRAGFNF